MKITVFGSGYVGLVQAAVLAERGNNVCCMDIDAERIAKLQRGELPIYEPGLAELVTRNAEQKRLVFSSDAQFAVQFSDVLFIAVGTPPDEDGSADLTHVLSVAKSIATHMQRHKTVVNKSTVPVGTADKVSQLIQRTLEQENKSQLSFSVVSNPEFLKEGAAVADCKRPDRIIIGTRCDKTEQLMRELYAPFSRNHSKIMVMDERSAELTKYAANCMLATKISFMNEMANIAEQVGADIEQVRQGIGSDPRIGYHFIYPGIGYGGSCFPKDIKALIQTANEHQYQSKILSAVEQVNQQQKSKLIDYIDDYFGKDLSNKRFALWGLSFKPNTNDMREAPALVLLNLLWQRGASVNAYDPQSMEEAQRLFGTPHNLSLMGTKEAALKGADALIICTEWENFRTLDFELLQNTLTHPVVFDGRNLFDPAQMARHGISYYCVGRGLSLK